MSKEVNSGLLLEHVHLSNELCQSVLKQSPFVQPGIRLDPHLKLCKFQLETDCCMHSQSFIVTLNAN